MSYADKTLTCRDCGQAFVFTTGDNTKRTWRVRGMPGGPKTYTYQIKYFSITGSVTTRPLTVTRPSSINCSDARRDAMPACDKIFCKRST